MKELSETLVGWKCPDSVIWMLSVRYACACPSGSVTHISDHTILWISCNAVDVHLQGAIVVDDRQTCRMIWPVEHWRISWRAGSPSIFDDGLIHQRQVVVEVS